MKVIFFLTIVVIVAAFGIYAKRNEMRVNTAIEALEALQVATNVGLPYADYSKRTIDTAIVVNRALSSIRDTERRRALQEILECYTVAGDYWGRVIQRTAGDIEYLDHRSRKLGIDLDLSYPREASQVTNYWSVASHRLRDFKTGTYQSLALTERPAERVKRSAIGANYIDAPPAPPPEKPGDWMWRKRGNQD
jgi:hypothetical protein